MPISKFHADILVFGNEGSGSSWRFSLISGFEVLQASLFDGLAFDLFPLK